MVGSPSADKSGRLPLGAKREFMAARQPKSRPAGVRASVVAAKRVTTVERRDAGKWMRDETRTTKSNRRQWAATRL